MEKISVFETAKQDIDKAFEQGEQNAISEVRLQEIGVILKNISNKALLEGRYTEDTAEGRAILNELKKSSVIVKTLPEFKYLLTKIAEKYDQSMYWVLDTLAHENAHANVANVEERFDEGYWIIFIKNEVGTLIAFHPMYVSHNTGSSNAKDALLKHAEVLKAPGVYGNRLSGGDVEDLQDTMLRLALLDALERGDQDDIKSLKLRLGITV